MKLRDNRKFNTICLLWPETVDWLLTLGYTYNSKRNIGDKRKYIVTDGYNLEYYISDTIHLDKKHYCFEDFADAYKTMTSYCSSVPLYKCYINNKSNIFVTKTILDKVPEDYKPCKYDEILDYCTQLSLTLL